MAMRDHLGTVGASASAVLVGSCCVAPVLFLLFGTTVGALSVLHVLDPYRAHLIATGVGLWGYGFYRLYLRRTGGTSGTACVGACERRSRRARILLWMALGGLVLAVVYPKLVLLYVGT